VTAIFNFIQILKLLFDLDLNFAKFQLQFGTIFPKRPQHFKGMMLCNAKEHSFYNSKAALSFSGDPPLPKSLVCKTKCVCVLIESLM